QAIRLLQLSTIDLQQEIQEALESNPMLEVEEGGDERDGASAERDGEDNYPEREREGVDKSGDEFTTPREASAESMDSDYEGQDFTPDESWNDKDIPEDLSVDSSWDDIYINTTPSSSGPASDSDDDYDFESRNSESESLQDYLHWQLNLTPMSDDDRIIATAIIDAIDPDGRLTVSIESIHTGLAGELEVDEDEVLAVLHRIQQFDPVGVGYRDLRECLMLQLQHLEDCPLLETAKKVADEFLPQLASRDYNQIMKKL